MAWIGIAVATTFTNNVKEVNLFIATIAFSLLFQVFNIIDFDFQGIVKSKFVVYALPIFSPLKYLQLKMEPFAW